MLPPSSSKPSESGDGKQKKMDDYKSLKDLCGELETELDKSLGDAPTNLPDPQEIESYIQKLTECEILCPLDDFSDPTILVCSTLPCHTTRAQLKQFFKENHIYTRKISFLTGNEKNTNRGIEIKFSSHEDLMKAVKLQGKIYPCFGGEKVYFDRVSSGLNSYMISGFVDMPIYNKQSFREELRSKFKPYGTIINIFLPQKEDLEFIGIAFISVAHHDSNPKFSVSEIKFLGMTLTVEPVMPRPALVEKWKEAECTF